MSVRSTAVVVPPFLTLAGHPLRWRMLVELAGSDRQVAELTRAVGQPQGLVSYHLGRLRSGGLVSAHRSSFDGRGMYYRLHLDRCGELLAATSAALHPGLDPGLHPGLRMSSQSTAPDPRRRVTVLFVCTGNGTRSQIAEALLRARVRESVEVISAGSHPKPIHPNAIKVLAERGIDISRAKSKPLAGFSGHHVDYVITLCDKVREICPEFPGQQRSMHWSIEDPSRLTGSQRATMPAFRSVAADLESRIEFLTPLIDTEQRKEHTRHG